MEATGGNGCGTRLPPGLRLAEEFVTPEEERDLIAQIEASDIAHVAYDPGNPRAERTYGWLYHYESHTISPGEPIPECFRDVLGRAAAFAGIEPQQVIQCLLLRYDPGSIIQPHCDMPAWGHVMGLSLGAPVTMEFIKETADDRESIAVELPPRSIYLQTGEARNVYQHSIPAVTQTRWGITFRDFSEEGLRMKEDPAYSSAP